MKTLLASQPVTCLANDAVSKDLPTVVIDDPSLPLVSIVTPSYNQGRFIRETIESVLSQDYRNLEYWVIDGESTDETLSVLKEYEGDPRFHWISEKDSGQSDAINKGLARCRGEIFNWLCSDDLLLPGALRRVVDAWTSFHQPCVVYGRARLVDEHSNDMGYGPGQSSSVTLTKILRSQCFLMQPATFAPTAQVRALGGVDNSYLYAMDLDLWVKLIERLPFHHIPLDLALCRLHRASKTVSLSARFIHDITRILQSAACRNLLSKSQAASYAHLFAAQVYLTPQAMDWRAAAESLVACVRADSSAVPSAILVLLKGVARALLGEHYWSKLRLARVRFA